MGFRNAAKADASSIAALSIEVWIGTYLRRGISAFFADYVLSEFTTQKTEVLIDDPNEIIIVSENSDGIDGFVRVSLSKTAPVNERLETEIATLYVQPRHHGKGIGKALLAEAIKICRERGVQSVWLTTNSENEPAIRFYEALGFKNVGKTQFVIQDQSYQNDVFAFKVC